jgi:hypothetical protein
MALLNDIISVFARENVIQWRKKSSNFQKYKIESPSHTHLMFLSISENYFLLQFQQSKGLNIFFQPKEFSNSF